MKSRGRSLTLLLALMLPATGAHAQSADPDVRVFINGAPAALGSYSFPFPPDSPGLVLDNGLVRLTFNGKTPASTEMLARSVIVNGVELAPLDGQNSFYVDSGGGTARLITSQVRVVRLSSDLAEVAFIDTTSSPLRPEHHLIMRRGRRALYGYTIERAMAATTISELRVVTRWNRTLLDHAFDWERGTGQQPTYAYLNTQTRVQDETWTIDGQNNPNLPPPDSNAGNLPPGTTYTKYNWSLYHHENPMFGHYGHGFGVWFTPLGGVSDQTLAAFYGVGPNHQDLAIHQDCIILNYFGPNHYGLPGYSLPAGYTRQYGPWVFFITVGDPEDPEGTIADAAAIAQAEIAENRSGADWVDDPLYPAPAQRTTVTGRVQIADGRPADGLWVLLSTQDATDVYTIHEPTYFVKTDAGGNFTIPGVAPPWAPGTMNPSSYVLYVFATKGSITEQYKQAGITFDEPVKDLGTITWAPTNRTTFLWQIGKADRMGGEFALATNPADWTNPRSYEKPSQVPGTLNFAIGSSWEPQEWYYAQTNPGTWTITFNLDRAYSGTAFLTVSSSMQQGSPPTVALDGLPPLTGSLPSNNDSTIARQADRSGRPRLAVLQWPAAVLAAGTNTITLTKTGSAAAGNGLGWDTLIFEVDETTAPPPAALSASLVGVAGTQAAMTWTMSLRNAGAGPANHALLDAFSLRQTSGVPCTPVVSGRDPNRFAVPLGNLAPGAERNVTVTIGFAACADDTRVVAAIPFSANGGRATTAVVSDDQYAFPDTTPPALTLPANQTLEATGPDGAAADFAASAVDTRDGTVPVSYSHAPGSVFPLGMTTVTVTARDAAGNAATGTFTVTVRDTTAPAFQSLTASLNVLWPPNHNLIAVSVTAAVADAVDPAPVTRIVAVASNEAQTGLWDGDIGPDWEITGALTLDLRAERAGSGSGRLYTITVESRDASGNASIRTVAVTVPHNQ